MFPKHLQKGLWIAAGVIAVVGLYGYVYRDSLRNTQIDITQRIVVGPPVRGLSRTNQSLVITQLVFGLDRKYNLTEVKVTPVQPVGQAELPPVWHLVSESNSIPVRVFAYGDHMRGLHPLVKKLHPQPLDTNVTYRLSVKAGRASGQCDFTVDQTIVPYRQRHHSKAQRINAERTE